MEKEYIIKIEVFAFKCLRCDHEWIPRVEVAQLREGVQREPKICPHCKSAYWNLPRKNKKKVGK